MSEQEPIQDKAVDQTVAAGKVAKESRRAHRSRSAFAPVVLIAAGVFFLLYNMGLVGGELNWAAAWQWWPLALIFLGLNVLVVQFPRPLGTLLRTLVGVVAVGVFGWLLLRGAPARFQQLGLAGAPELQAETFNLTPGTAERATVTLNLSNMTSRIHAGDGGDLIAGTIWTRSGLDLQPGSSAGNTFEVSVGERPGGFSVNPADWFSGGSDGRSWEFALTPDLPLDLTLNGGNGSVTADLTGLMLSALAIDGGNGAATVTLPGGDYEAKIDSGNGAVNVSLPTGVAARVTYNTGNGFVRVDDRFQRLSGDGDGGVFQTDGYDTAAERVLLVIDTGNGSVTVNEGGAR